jgi:TetR/AcrR family transcriptional repressor of lmrAB and yxaGH operons
MGRTARVDDEVMYARLAGVFRASGYTGASLSALSEAVGLQRASLYHRFPEGKPAMATAVLTSLAEQLEEALGPLESEPDVAEGVAAMARHLARTYQDGRMACALDTMTLNGAPEKIRAQAGRIATRWVEAMAAAAVRAGADQQDANVRARQALVQIEGALVVSRVLGDTSVFEQALAGLPDLLAS